MCCVKCLHITAIVIALLNFIQLCVLSCCLGIRSPNESLIIIHVPRTKFKIGTLPFLTKTLLYLCLFVGFNKQMSVLLSYITWLDYIGLDARKPDFVAWENMHIHAVRSAPFISYLASMIVKFAICKKWIFQLVSIAEQCAWSESIFKDRFSCDEANILS